MSKHDRLREAVAQARQTLAIRGADLDRAEQRYRAAERKLLLAEIRLDEARAREVDSGTR